MKIKKIPLDKYEELTKAITLTAENHPETLFLGQLAYYARRVTSPRLRVELQRLMRSLERDLSDAERVLKVLRKGVGTTRKSVALDSKVPVARAVRALQVLHAEGKVKRVMGMGCTFWSRV